MSEEPKKPLEPPELIPVSKSLNIALNSLQGEIIADRKIKNERKFKILSINLTWNPGCVLVERGGHWYWICSD